jgi:hypothetical protein
MFTPTLARLVSAADIIVTENVAKESSRYTEDVYNNLSSGKISVEDAMIQLSSGTYIRNGFHEIDVMYDIKFFEMIAGSGKRIYVERSPFTSAEYEQSQSAWNPPSAPCTFHDMTPYLKACEEKLRGEANCLVLREKEFVVLLSGLLKEQPESRMLVLRGAGHQRVIEKLLREQGVKFESHLFDERIRFLLRVAIVSRLAMGLRVKRNELAMGVVQAFELDRLYGTNLPTMEDVLKSYNTVAAMTASELELQLYLRSHGRSVF